MQQSKNRQGGHNEARPFHYLGADRVKVDDGNDALSIWNLPNLLQDMYDIGLMELIDNAYKFKQTKERELVEETLVEITIQYALFSESETCFAFFKKNKPPRTTICSTTNL